MATKRLGPLDALGPANVGSIADNHGRLIATPVPRSTVRRFKKRPAVDLGENVRLVFDLMGTYAKMLAVEWKQSLTWKERYRWQWSHVIGNASHNRNRRFAFISLHKFVYGLLIISTECQMSFSYVHTIRINTLVCHSL